MNTPQPYAARCAAVRADLPGLDGHELSSRRAFEIRSHLVDCADCGEVAASYRAMRRTLAGLHETQIVPPAGLLDQLLDAAENPGFAERAAVLGRGAVSGSRPRVAAAGLGVGAMAAGGLGLLAWHAVRSRRTLA
jgi:hypothetical protein